MRRSFFVSRVCKTGISVKCNEKGIVFVQNYTCIKRHICPSFKRLDLCSPVQRDEDNFVKRSLKIKDQQKQKDLRYQIVGAGLCEEIRRLSFLLTFMRSCGLVIISFHHTSACLDRPESLPCPC